MPIRIMAYLLLAAGSGFFLVTRYLNWHDRVNEQGRSSDPDGTGQVLLSAESSAAEEDFYLLTLSEGGQYVGSRSDPVAKSRSDSSSRLGPFETTVRLDPVVIADLGWFDGELVETWHRRMDGFWATLDHDRRRFDPIEGVDLSELAEEGRATLESLRDQWRLTIEPRIRQHAALESYLEDVKVIERLILGLREYRYQGTAVRQQFRGGEWYALSKDPTSVYEVTANAEGWSKEVRYPVGEDPGPGGSVRGSKLLVWRFDPEDMARAAELMADWLAIENAIGPQLDARGATVWGSAELQGIPNYGDHDWFVTCFRQGLEIIMGAAWTLTPHALPERLQYYLPTDLPAWEKGPLRGSRQPSGQPGSGGPTELRPWKPSEQGPKDSSDSGQAPLKNQHFTIGGFRYAIPPGTPLELPPIVSGTLMRFEAAHSPIAEIEFQVEGRELRTGAANYRYELELDGVYRPKDSVGGIPSPAPRARRVLPLEHRRPQLNSATGVQATNLTSPHLAGWYYIQINGEVPDDALVGELQGHWLTDNGEEFRTQLTWQVLLNGKAPEIEKEKMDLRIVRLSGDGYQPIDGPLDFGAHFFIDGRLEEDATREAYVVKFALPDGETQRAILTPTEEDRRLLRSEMHYLIFEMADRQDGE